MLGWNCLQTDTSVRAKFIALRNSLYSTVFVCVLGGLLFILCSAYVVNDKKRAEELAKLNELGVMEAVEDNIQENIQVESASRPSARTLFG